MSGRTTLQRWRGIFLLAMVAAVVVSGIVATSASAAPTCTIYWTGASGDSEWSDASNWSTGAVPKSSDYVCLAASASSTEAEISDLTVKVAGINWSSGMVDVSSGLDTASLVLGSASSTMSGLTVDGGSGLGASVQTTGPLTVTSLNLDTGELDGPGKITVPSSHGGADFAGYSELGGSVAATHLDNEGTLTLSGADTLLGPGTTIENGNLLDLGDASEIEAANGCDARITNDPGAEIDYKGSSSATLGLPVTNEGTVSVEHGTLSLAANGCGMENDATMSATAGGTLLDSGPITFTDGASETGNGTFSIPTGSTLTAQGQGSADELTLAGGDVEGPGTLSTTPNGNISLTASSTLGENGSGPHLVSNGTMSATPATAYQLWFANRSELENAGAMALNGFMLLETGMGTASSVINDADATITSSQGSEAQALDEVRLTNNGTLIADSGTLQLTSLANLSGGKLTGGTYKAIEGGQLQLPGDVTTNAATANVRHGTFLDNDGNDALDTLLWSNSGIITWQDGELETSGSLSNSGSIDLEGGDLSTSGSVTNSGTITIDGAELEPGGNYTQTAGTTRLTGDSPLLTVPDGSATRIVGGTVTGGSCGSASSCHVDLEGNVTTSGSGTIIQGPTDPLAVDDGNLTLRGGLTVTVNSDGTSTPFSTDRTASLGGALTLQLAAGYVPAVGKSFVVLGADAITGTFQSLHLPALPKRQFAVSYSATAVTVTVLPGAPTVTKVSPNAGPTGGGNTVAITGTGFMSGATVSFGATAARATVASSTKITVRVPAHAAGTVDVTVKTSSGTSPTSAADKYVYEAAPTVTAVSPASGPTSGGNTVTISGSNFHAGATVRFGGTAATGVSVVSGSTITAQAPAGTARTVDVTVTTPGGTSATGSADKYVYETAPIVSAVSPSSGATVGGTRITITGTGFASGSTVSVGGSAATAVTVVSGTRITATTPAHAAGTFDVKVTTPGGTSATGAGDRFTYS